jgi:hypothetical protein
VSLEPGPLSLVNTTEELRGRENSGSGLENKNTAVGICCADHATPSIRKKLALASPTSGGRSVDIVRPRTKTTEFVLFCFLWFQRLSEFMDTIGLNTIIQAPSSGK